MKFTKLLLVAVLISVIPSISFSQVAGGTVAEQQDYTFALGLYRDGQYQLALQQFKTFLKNYPNSQRVDEITFLSGECLLQERMYDSALGEYEKVMDGIACKRGRERDALRPREL